MSLRYEERTWHFDNDAVDWSVGYEVDSIPGRNTRIVFKWCCMSNIEKYLAVS